jgi:peptidoglycan hydrolase-like protein with peptidoglycan-binding domain
VNPKDYPIYASVLPPPGDLSKPEIEIVQARLRELGYHTVGKVDGQWGSMTTGAIAAFQDRAGLPVTGQYDEATVVAMKDGRNQRPISVDRATVTVSELRAEGSKTIKAADKVSIGSLLLTGISGAVAVVTFVANHWEEANKMADAVRPVLQWIPAAVWPAVVAGFGFSIFLGSRTIKQARVDAERTGVHNGEPGTDALTVGEAHPAEPA